MPHPKSEVVGKPYQENMTLAAHAIREGAIMPLLLIVLNFLRSRLREKHNASVIIYMSATHKARTMQS